MFMFRTHVLHTNERNVYPQKEAPQSKGFTGPNFQSKKGLPNKCANRKRCENLQYGVVLQC